MIFMFLTGLINLYGIKNILYVFTSYGQKILKEKIIELLPLSFSSSYDKFIIFMIFLSYFLYFRCKNIQVRYYLLLFGTTYLAFDCSRSIAFFMIGALFPLSYLYRDKIPNIDAEKFIQIKRFIIIFIIILVPYSFTLKNFYPESKESIDYLAKKSQY